MHTCIFKYINTYIHTHTYTFKRIHTYIHIHTHAYVHTHTHIIHTYIHIHVRLPHPLLVQFPFTDNSGTLPIWRLLNVKLPTHLVQCPFPDKSSTPPHLKADKYTTPRPSLVQCPSCASYGIGQDYLGEGGVHSHFFSHFMLEIGEGEGGEEGGEGVMVTMA